MNTTNKEIDIFELYRIASKFFRRRFVVLLIIALLGAIFGLVKVKMQGVTYQTRIIVRSDFISKEDLSSKAMSLLEDDRQMATQDLAILFNTDETVFRTVSKVKLDTLSLNNAIVFKFWIKDTANFDEITKTINKYYNTSVDFLVQFARIQNQNQHYVDVIKNEIDKIVAFQKKVLENDNSKQSLMLSGFSGSSGELVSLLEKQQNLELKLYAKQPVYVVQNSVVMSKSASLTGTMIVWAFVFGVIGLLIFLFVELDRGARRRT